MKGILPTREDHIAFLQKEGIHKHIYPKGTNNIAIHLMNITSKVITTSLAYHGEQSITTRNDAIANAYIWLQYGNFGCNWNQLHLNLLVDRWLQLERCISLRQPLDVVLQHILLLQ
jgi:hypothetical protein